MPDRGNRLRRIPGAARISFARGLAGIPLAGIVLGGIATAAPEPPCDTTARCLAVLESGRASGAGWTARFEQRKETSLLAEPIVTRGRITVESADRIVWDIEEPENERIVFGSATGTDVDPRLGEAFRFLRSILGAEVGPLERDFVVEARDRDGGIELVLEPRAPEVRELVERIDVRFAGDRPAPERIAILDPFGDRVTIDFTRDGNPP